MLDALRCLYILLSDRHRHSTICLLMNFHICGCSYVPWLFASSLATVIFYIDCLYCPVHCTVPCFLFYQSSILTQEFEVLTTPIDMLMIREKLARFLVEQVMRRKESSIMTSDVCLPLSVWVQWCSVWLNKLSPMFRWISNKLWWILNKLWTFDINVNLLNLMSISCEHVTYWWLIYISSVNDVGFWWAMCTFVICYQWHIRQTWVTDIKLSVTQISDAYS